MRASLRSRPFKDFAPHYAATQAVFTRYRWILNKKVLNFYSNAHGRKFSNFVEVVGAPKPEAPRYGDLPLTPGDYYVKHDHPRREKVTKVSALLEA